MNTPDLIENENIKDVEGYEGIYAITDFGRVWSYAKQMHNGKWLKYGYDGYGYRQVNLIINKKNKVKKVARLVACAFIANPLNKKQVNHKDRNRSNNHYLNLEWCTNYENVHHGIKASIANGRAYKHRKFFNKYFPVIKHLNKRYYLGGYKTHEEADMVYTKKRMELRGY